jgi:hypothetical protein
MQSVKKEEGQSQKRHAIFTCYDGRIDDITAMEIDRIRSQGGLLAKKDILRPPGGVHLLAGKTDCRKTFYELLAGYYGIAGTTVFHFWPHTNCQYCGLHFQEKLGSGAQSDLRFHVRSAEKLRDGALHHFASLEKRPEIDVRIILTTDQRIVTIDEAHELLPHVPVHGHHGSPCFAQHEHTAHHPPS